ncbi:hypothetical protein FRC07_007174 [Ceratobasidium sp. 392]|nr:hypothetical protein FRC07_007174 [Ceratobasidium sp. 392]
MVDAGPEVKFTLELVTKVHNLWFDAGLHIVSFLHMRRAFVGFENLQDIFQSKDAFLVIKPEMRKDPLFCERSAKGLELGPGPAAAKNMTATYSAMGKDVGISGVTGHSIRRESGNCMSLVVGVTASQELLMHDEDRTTLSIFYSHNTLNLPVVMVQLGELDHTASLINQMALKRNSNSEMLVQALIRGGKTPSSALPTGKAVEVTLSKEELAEARTNPAVVKLDQQLDELWNQFYELMPEQAKVSHGQRTTATINKVFKKYEDNPEYQASKTELLWASIQRDLKDLGVRRHKAWEAVLRPIQTAKRREALSEANLAQRTTEQGEQAQQLIEKLFESLENLPDVNLSCLVASAAAIAGGTFKPGILTKEAV